MATPLTDGKIYFLESENGIEDWITDHGGDPDLIDLSQFTAEGTDWVSINIPRGFAIRSSTGIVVTASGGGASFDERSAKRFYKALQQGIQTSLANANLVDKFAMSNRHTSEFCVRYQFLFQVLSVLQIEKLHYFRQLLHSRPS